jgi:hypothetical protein
MFPTKILEKINTHNVGSIAFFFCKSYGLLDNVEKYVRSRQATGENIIRRMRIACWKNKATKHLKYVLLIALPQQQLLREGTLLLFLMYIAPLVLNSVS